MSVQQQYTGWNDCDRLIQRIRSEWPRSVEVRLITRARRMNGTGHTAWGVLVRTEALQGPAKATVWHRAYWGPGEEAQTAPGALHRALTKVLEDLEGAQAVAEQAAMF